MGRLLVGIVLIMVGLSALLEIDLWHFFWPGVLILLGVWFILDKPGHWYGGLEGRRGRKDRRDYQEGEFEEVKEKDAIHYSATFQGLDRKITSDDFKGGSVNSTFGGVNLDLRGAKIKGKDPVTLKVDATLGGIKIYVPKTWQVENHANGVAGGISDSTNHPSEKERTGTLRLIGQATLGGVEITN